VKRFYLPALGLTLVATLFLVGGALRSTFAFQEPVTSIAQFQAALHALRTSVVRLGWVAPFGFVVLVIIRYFVFLPSALVLTAGGLAFGSLEGTLLSTIGIFLSSLVQYTLGRLAGRELLSSLFGNHFQRLDTMAERIGPWIIWVGTVHPAGSMGLFHTAGGFSAMPVGEFILPVALAAPIRAGAYAFLGASLIEMPWWVSVLLALAMVAVGGLPLLVPRVREKFLGKRKEESNTRNVIE